MATRWPACCATIPPPRPRASSSAPRAAASTRACRAARRAATATSSSPSSCTAWPPRPPASSASTPSAPDAAVVIVAAADQTICGLVGRCRAVRPAGCAWALAVAVEEALQELRQVGLGARLACREQLVVARALALVDHAEVARLLARRDAQRRLEVVRVVVGRQRRDLLAVGLEGVHAVERRARTVRVDDRQPVVLDARQHELRQVLR